MTNTFKGVSVPLQAFSRPDLFDMLRARDRVCLMSGGAGTDCHEFIVPRNNKHGEGAVSKLWHPYNAVLLNNGYHIEGGATSAQWSLVFLQHVLLWHGEDELNGYIAWLNMRTGAKTVEQWAWRQAKRLSGFSDLTITNNVIRIKINDFWREVKKGDLSR